MAESWIQKIKRTSTFPKKIWNNDKFTGPLVYWTPPDAALSIFLIFLWQIICSFVFTIFDMGIFHAFPTMLNFCIFLAYLNFDVKCFSSVLKLNIKMSSHTCTLGNQKGCGEGAGEASGFECWSLCWSSSSNACFLFFFKEQYVRK